MQVNYSNNSQMKKKPFLQQICYSIILVLYLFPRYFQLILTYPVATRGYLGLKVFEIASCWAIFPFKKTQPDGNSSGSKSEATACTRLWDQTSPGMLKYSLDCGQIFCIQNRCFGSPTTA